jgi:hypothetical protein
MKKSAAHIACALLLAATSAPAQVPQVLGVWEFDPQASELPPGFLLASETRSYDLRNDGYLVNVVIRKAPNGRPDFIQIASKSDGKDYPQYQSFPLAEFQINGTKTPFTYSETVLDEHAVNVVAKYGDRVVNRGVRRVAPDGKTMRIDVTAIDQSGKETPFFLVFNKVG